MNLGFRQQRMAKMKRPRWALLTLVGVWTLSQSAALAQDMSFDLDETETFEDEGGSDAESGGSEASAETEGEASAEVEGEASGSVSTGGGDIFSELSSTDDSGITGEEQAEKKEKEVVEEIYAVQRMYVLRNGRFELAPSLAFAVNDPYTSRTALTAALNYWITNVLAIGANFLWYQGLESESELNFSVRRSARLAVPITEYQLGAHLNFTYVPIYGKFTMFNDAIFQWDSYLVGGVGMMRTRPIAVVDPAVRKFNFDWRISFNVGIGIRVFITKWLSVFAELRDYIYLEKLENLDVALGAARDDEATWIDENSSITNNFAAHIGLSLFFPFTFEYGYPK